VAYVTSSLLHLLQSLFRAKTTGGILKDEHGFFRRQEIFFIKKLFTTIFATDKMDIVDI